MSDGITKRSLGDDKILIDPGKTLDNSNAGDMLEILNSALMNGVKFAILDMANLELLSSAGVGALLGTLEAFRDEGGDIVLCNIPDKILHVLQVLDLAEFMTIKADVKRAEVSCRKG